MTAKIKPFQNPVENQIDPTITQAGQYFQCNNDTIRKLITDGLLEAYNLGTRGTRIKWESMVRIRNGEAA